MDINQLLDQVINVASDLKSSNHSDELKTTLFRGYLENMKKNLKKLKGAMN